MQTQTREQPSGWSPEKWVSTRQGQAAFCIFLPSGARAVPGVSMSALWFPGCGRSHRHELCWAPADSSVGLIPPCCCHCSVPGQVLPRDRSASDGKSPSPALPHLIVKPHHRQQPTTSKFSSFASAQPGHNLPCCFLSDAHQAARDWPHSSSQSLEQHKAKFLPEFGMVWPT